MELPLSFDSSFIYPGCVKLEIVQKICCQSKCIAQGLTITVLHYSFISVLLCHLLLYINVSSSSVLLCCPHHVLDLPLLMVADQCHDITNAGRIHCDTMCAGNVAGDAVAYVFLLSLYELHGNL